MLLLLPVPPPIDLGLRGQLPQGVHSTCAEQRHEFLNHRDRDTKCDRRVSVRRPTHHGLHDAKSHLERHYSA